MALDTHDMKQVAWQVRCLLRSIRHATLATVQDGQPYAALVTHACAADLSILLLLSGLSEHMRHLRMEKRAALMVSGKAETVNPQTAPRVTVTGLAERVDDPALRQRFLAVHPYAAPYAGFSDFSLVRLKPLGAMLVGGFARATRLPGSVLCPDEASVTALVTVEAEIITHCNADHADALARIAQGGGGKAASWRMVAVDCDGCDLAPDDPMSEPVLRMHWSAPVSDASGVRQELVRLARA
ncbi:Hypothetical protein GbCGDNIH6_1970 [Granulibacter bethesdensis]|uniref:HugZ family pyridoxamine 5'-phosphate oxidase n=1 Tax=Granulibacter bethesdensis TaxID=364410 RepID=UPI00090B3FF1|nr:DUF2470 domain-containing protein [Granulibacter bethesdensis]APH57796.1 Hypothetical protein GbCGDNIH6_1970 [Granulibacter bethesdensis]